MRIKIKVPRHKNKAEAKNIFTGFVGLVLAVWIAISTTGCAPSFPREVLPEAVKTVCKAEYGMTVDVTVVGTTMGIYYPMEGLLDAGLGISEASWDKISNLLLIASRVVLSTDAEIQFYCVITQDVRLPEMQVVIIKYVEDVKYGMYRNISRNESFKRTLFTVNLTPQAQKERSIEAVFDKLDVGDDTREDVLEEFFRSVPTKLKDIGYWKGNFYLKEIVMEEFLASQIANRVKLDFKGDKKLSKLFDYKSSESLFNYGEDSKFFLVKYKIIDQSAEETPEELKSKKLQEILRIANEVVYGYKFESFDFLVLEDQMENVKFKISGQDVYDFTKEKLTVEDIVHEF